MGKLFNYVKEVKNVKEFDEENKILIDENSELKQTIVKLGNQKQEIENQNWELTKQIEQYKETFNKIKKDIIQINSNNSVVDLKNHLQTLIGGYINE